MQILWMGREATGNLTLALRGSLELVDFTLTDNQILVREAGYDQIAALYNWWLRATASSTLEVKQYKVVEYDETEPPVSALLLYEMPGPDIWSTRKVVLERVSDARGTGELLAALALDPDGKIAVAGHSLGGHLAKVLGSRFDGISSSVAAFDSLGFVDSTANRDFFRAFDRTE
jgi:pimeloyl-ACP methyl ester carboxylesterase